MKTRLQACRDAWTAAAPGRWWRRLLLAALAAAGGGATPAHAVPVPRADEWRAIDRVDEIRARLLATDRVAAVGEHDAAAPGSTATSDPDAPVVAQWANWAKWQKWAKWNNWGKV
jgi:hypothetical protein